MTRTCPLVAPLACVLVWLAAASCPAPDGERDPARARERMVEQQIRARGVRDARVLAAMRKVERHRFVPESQRARAYADRPLPIGRDQTISQPYIVAAMTELARIERGDRVLEVGTGSGYQAAVLAELADRARAALESAGYTGVHVRSGDGYRGWAERAPFDAILVTAAAPRVPPPLLEQLAPGGRLVIPVGRGEDQMLEVWERRASGVERSREFPVRFVPMTGESEREE